MTHRSLKKLALLLLVLGLPGGCRRAQTATHEQPSLDTTEQRKAADDAMQQATLEPGMLKTVPGVLVIGRTGPGGQPFEVARRTPIPPLGYARTFGTITLDVALRQDAREPSQYPCVSCHLGARLALNRTRVADAHRNIQPVHPAETGATCRSCHAPENVELLAFQFGERVTMDHAYQLCAQCHSAKVEAWAGGAHGKRLDGWQGRRVVMNCTACHDPHRPAPESRIPFAAPVLERRRSHQP